MAQMFGMVIEPPDATRPYDARALSFEKGESAGAEIRLRWELASLGLVVIAGPAYFLRS